MKLQTVSIFVDDQDKAKAFYTDTLGFEVTADVPVGEFRWLTVAAGSGSEVTQLSLEPAAHPAAATFAAALYSDGIPYLVLGTDDIATEHRRLTDLGVRFASEPTNVGPVIIAVFDDTCGNLIQLAQASGA